MVVDSLHDSFAYFLDIFSGASSPVSVAVRALHADSIEPVDLIFGQHCDLLDDLVFQNVLDLAASGLIGAALAAPYCSKHSMATLRPNGPKPVRTPAALDGLPTNTALQDLQVQESATVHDRARHILTLVAAKGGIVVIENPLTSMTWLDGLMSAWVRATSPYLAAAAACRFGEDWQKSWLFCSNKVDILAIGLGCDHNPKSYLNFAGLRLPDGSFYSRLTACYPKRLAEALAQVFLPYLSRHSKVATLRAWPSCLPSTFTAQPLIQRVEDGGGLISTAVWHSPQAPDVLGGLRKRWTSRILRMGLHSHILSHFAKGSKDPPLSDQQLHGFLMDVREFVDVPDRIWDQALQVAPGQPFRLDLWRLLLREMNDPDIAFLDELVSGVHWESTMTSQLPLCGPYNSQLFRMTRNCCNVNLPGRAPWTNLKWFGNCSRMRLMQVLLNVCLEALHSFNMNTSIQQSASLAWFVLTIDRHDWWSTQPFQVSHTIHPSQIVCCCPKSLTFCRPLH